MTKRTCPCGVVFVDSSKTRPRKWCDDCRRPHLGGNPVQTWTCGHCGIECSRPRVRGQRPKWCSQKCADLGKAGRAGVCARCGVGYFGLGEKFCSIGCVPERRRVKTLVHVGPAEPRSAPTVAPTTFVTLPKWWGVITQGPCAWCETPFTSTGHKALYCSKRCQRAATQSRRPGSFQIQPRARKAIYERDAWTCQLCYEPVDPTADPLSDWFPSLDHIVPQSHTLIPDHSPSNLRTAHRWCNAVRGDGTYHADLFEEAS